MRLKDKTAVIVGGGQTPGETIGNGRATALRFAQEGARVMVVDNRLDSAEDTVAMITEAGGEAVAFAADITREADCAGLIAAARERFGGLDILHNNVGRSRGDSDGEHLDETQWREIMDMNLFGMAMTCKHALPVMREGGGGSIINISSVASLAAMGTVIYRLTKVAVNALTQELAIEYADHGIRVNAILPGLMDTPMAIERRAMEQNISRDEVRTARNRRVPLGRQMGTAWDVANAALYLASDEARFVTGVLLPVDGGQLARVG